MKRFGMVVLMGLVLGVNVQAQTKTQTISGGAVRAGSGRVPSFVSVAYRRTVDVSDTTHVVYVTFENQEYRNITDLKIVGFYKESDLTQFITHLKSAYQQMISGEKAEVSWDERRYNLTVTEYTQDILLIRVDGGYTTVKTKEVVKLIEILSTIQFGK
jgi:hypothetical protein